MAPPWSRARAPVTWRFRRGWTERELSARLAATRPDARNFDDPPEAMLPSNGWNHVRSQARVARDAPGAPRAGDAFDRARGFVERFEFSDPRIVVGHFDARRPLLGRVVLLELRPFALRFLCPAAIGAVREESHDGVTTFGYALETLDGHVERGREWFLLTKDHATGDVRFRVEAAWRSGQFPAWWARAGFQLTGRRYQRAWHRLAHVRLRTLLALGVEPGRAPQRLAHAGVGVPTDAIQFYARRAAGARRVGVEREDEKMGRRDRLSLAVGLAALAGARSLLGPAILSILSARAPDRAAGDLLSRALASPRTARVLAALAAGELVADKVPGVPDRIRPMPLAARAASGALTGHVAARRGGATGPAGAVLGALAAVGVTWASWRLRGFAAAQLPATLAAVLEDAVVAGTATALARRIVARPLREAPALAAVRA